MRGACGLKKVFLGQEKYLPCLCLEEHSLGKNG